MSSSSFGGLRPSAPAPDENIYEEPQRRRESEEWRRPGEHFLSISFHSAHSSKGEFPPSSVGGLLWGGNQTCKVAGSHLGLERRDEEDGEGEGYDHLDFARTQELKPHYHSTDTLRSSPQSAQSR